MLQSELTQGTIPYLRMILFLIIVIREIIRKGIALWKAGRNNQLTWFIFILILNTAGILPILYILFFQKKEKVSNTNIHEVKKILKPKKIVAKRK